MAVLHPGLIDIYEDDFLLLAFRSSEFKNLSRALAAFLFPASSPWYSFEIIASEDRNSLEGFSFKDVHLLEEISLDSRRNGDSSLLSFILWIPPLSFFPAIFNGRLPIADRIFPLLLLIGSHSPSIEMQDFKARPD
jgi:hypothetical protein